VGTKFSLSVQNGPEAHPASCTRGTRSLLRGLCGRGVALTTHLHLVPRLKKEYSYTSTPHLDLYDVTGRNLPLTLSYVVGCTCDEVSVFRCNDINTYTYPLTWRQINTVNALLPQTHLNNTRTCTYEFRYTLPGTEIRGIPWLPSVSLYVAVCHQYVQLFASPWIAVCSPVLQQCYATSGPRVFQLNLYFPIPEGNFFSDFNI